MTDKEKIVCAVNSIINETMSYDFPFLASDTKKQQIIWERKQHIEKQFLQLIQNKTVEKELLEQFWRDSVEHTEESFSSLSQKIKVNVFYLQELMHTYSEKIAQLVLAKIEEE